MHYFVTGATGFIGGALVQQLLAAGHQVTALVRDREKAADLAEQGVFLALGDITDRESLQIPMRGLDGVFHLAAWYKVGVKGDEAHTINVEGTRNVLEIALELGIPKVVYTSTLAVNSDTHGKVVDESYQFHGQHLSQYDRTKWQAHFQVAEPLRAKGLPLIIVLPGVTYGPGDTSMVHDLWQQLIDRKLDTIPEGLGACFGHVEDTARGHLQAMDLGRIGENYIIAGHPRTFEVVLHEASTIVGAPMPHKRMSAGMMKFMAAMLTPVAAMARLDPALHPETLREMAGTTYYGSNAKAVRELGLEHRPLKEGLEETLAWEMQQ